MVHVASFAPGVGAVSVWGAWSCWWRPSASRPNCRPWSWRWWRRRPSAGSQGSSWPAARWWVRCSRALPALYWPSWPGWPAFSQLLVPALVITLISFLETASSAKVDSQKGGQRWNQDQDLIGQGLAKISSGLCGAFSHQLVVFALRTQPVRRCQDGLGHHRLGGRGAAGPAVADTGAAPRAAVGAGGDRGGGHLRAAQAGRVLRGCGACRGWKR